MTPITAAAARAIRSASARRSGNSLPISAGWRCRFAEAYGGLGAGAVETGIVMEAFGRGLVSEPYLVDRGDRRRPDRRMRQRGAEAGDAAQGRRRLAPSGVRAFGARGALRSRAGRDHGDEDGRRLAARRPQDRRARRPCGGADHRLGPRRQRRRRGRKIVPVPGSRRHARPHAARLRAARRRPRLQPRSRQRPAFPPTPCSATTAMRCRRSRPWSTARWPRSAPRRSASCRSCST